MTPTDDSEVRRDSARTGIDHHWPQIEKKGFSPIANND